MDIKKYMYSPSENAFYPFDLQEVYESAGTWPVDAIEVKDSVYAEFGAKTPPEGKQRAAGKNGKPTWVAASPPDPEMLVAIAVSDKTRRLAEAAAAIAPLQDALDEGIATDEELKQLKAWKTYRVMLNRVDVSKAPDITWPDKPE